MVNSYLHKPMICIICNYENLFHAGFICIHKLRSVPVADDHKNPQEKGIKHEFPDNRPHLDFL